MNEENEFTGEETEVLWKKYNRLRAPIAGAVAAMGMLALGVYAEINVNFGSSLDATNVQSNGDPMDTTFTFELGTFTEMPTAANSSSWRDIWQAAPNSNPGESGSTVPYTQDAPPDGFEFLTPNTGASNNFAGAITLDSNDAPFQEGARGYIWGFDTREEGETGEWILLTNPAWLYPEVEDGLQPVGENWLVSDAGTVVVGGIGSVNPSHSSPGDAPHLATGSVFIAPAIPEPSALLFLAGSAGFLAMRRRR